MNGHQPEQIQEAGDVVAARKNDLADAAQDALDGSGNADTPIQETLVPACKVNFNGMSFDSIEDVPELKQEVTFRVKGMITQRAQKLMKTGDLRELATCQVHTVELLAE